MGHVKDIAGLTQAKGAVAAAAILFVLTLAAYSGSFKADFHFDDYHQIVMNQNVRDAHNIPRFFIDATLGSYDPQLTGYRPVTYASFAVNYAVSGNRVWSYHVFNILLHFFCAYMVFVVVGSVLREAGRDDGFMLPLAVASVFALHPIQTSAVTYISGRAAMLASLFTMLSFYAFLKLRSHGEAAGRRRIIWGLLSPAFYFLGLLSKEMAICLPLLCLAYDALFTFGRQGGPARAARAAMYYIPFAAATAAYMLARRVFSGFYVVPSVPFGPVRYMMTEAKVLLLYVRLLVLPVNQNSDYSLAPASGVDALVVVSVLLVAFALVMLYRHRRSAPETAFFGLWFFIALAPESTLVPIPDVAVEYRLYLPSVGFIAVAVILAAGLLKKREAIKKALAFTVIAMLLILTFSRNRVWATEYTLWSDVVKKAPYSARAHASMGLALGRENRLFEALEQYKTAVRMDPNYPQLDAVFNNMGKCLAGLGMYDEAVKMYDAAIRHNPLCMEAYGNMGAAYYKTGRFAEAIEVLARAEKLDPGFSSVHLGLAMSYTRLGRHEAALDEARLAYRYFPKDFEVNYNFAVVLANNGRMDDAKRQAEEALGYAYEEDQRKDAEKLLTRLKAGGR